MGVLAANGTDLLILEAYPLKGRGSSRLEYESVMQLKTLYNSMDMPFQPEVYSVPIVVILRPAESQRVISYPELARRFEPLGLPLWSWNADFRAWLHAYESWLPLEEPSHLASSEVGQRIIDASDRTVGSIVRILRQVAVKAIQSGKRSIHPDDIGRTESTP